MRSVRLLSACLVAAAVALSGCTATNTDPGLSSKPDAAITTDAPAPFVPPPAAHTEADLAVVPPYATGIEVAIRRAFGSMLDTCSVQATDLAGIIYDDGTVQQGFYVMYRLKGCPTGVNNYTPDVSRTGIIPPISSIHVSQVNRDAMSPARLRELLRAWAQVSKKPFGAVEPYTWVPEPRDLTIGGKSRPMSDLWIVTLGATNTADYYRIQHRHWPDGYVFSYPETGAPEYLGIKRGMGEAANIGD